MIKFHRILLLTLVAVFLASAAGIARYAADSCTQSRMYRQLAAQTENFPGDAASTGNNFLPQYQALYTQNSDLAGWIQIDGTNINYPVMQSKHDPDFYLKHNFEKADSPHGCPYVQANCDLQTPSDNILVYGHNMKDGTICDREEYGRVTQVSIREIRFPNTHIRGAFRGFVWLFICGRAPRRLDILSPFGSRYRMIREGLIGGKFAIGHSFKIRITTSVLSIAGSV